MKLKQKKIIGKIFVIMLIVTLLFGVFVIKGEYPSFADSGFSVSYDGNGNKNNSDIGFIMVLLITLVPEEYRLMVICISIFLIPITLMVIYTVIKRIITQNMKKDEKNTFNEIKNILPDFDRQEFLRNGYDIYCKVQNAWMNFKLDSVKDILDIETYEKYKVMLDKIQEKGEQDIFNKFKLKKCFLSSVIEKNGTIVIGTKYIVEQYDYTIKKDSNRVVRGTRHMKQKVTYEITFKQIHIQGQDKWVMLDKEKIHEEVV